MACTRAGTVFRAKPSSRRRISRAVCVRSISESRNGSRRRNYFFRLSAYRDRLLAPTEEHPEFVVPESRRNEMLRVLEAGLEDISVSRAGQAWGIPVPFDPSGVVSLVRRADQLRRGRRVRPESGALRQVVAGGPPSGGQGHHSISLPGLARDADERGRGAATPGLRPWLGAHERAEAQQVARERARSAGCGRSLWTGPAAAVPGQGDRLRIGRGFHLGPVRREIQRRSREQPGQSRQSRDGDGRALPSGPAQTALVGSRSAPRPSSRRVSSRLPREPWTRLALDRACHDAFRIADATKRVHRLERAVGARQAGSRSGSSTTCCGGRAAEALAGGDGAA